MEIDDSEWPSRRFYIFALICQTVGANSVLYLPINAINSGATGYILVCIFIFIFLGIPLHYMEFIVSQFTARDCIDIWKICPLLSHVGYFQMAWQIALIIYHHITSSFILHYFLISFENPIPYYICGEWASSSCNILAYNYTINEDCIKSKEPLNYCDVLYRTFPEYQYWRRYILGYDKNMHVAWRCCVSSGLIASIMFLSCFKGKQSARWFITVFALYPMIGYIIILMGSMQQKGIVRMYEEAMDIDFEIFSEKIQITDTIIQVLYALNIGVGISFNLGSSTSFRSPCYANTVITVVVCCIFSVVAICVLAMMVCPYAYEYGIQPKIITNYPITLIFERTPRLLREYENTKMWLLLTYSCNAALALNINFILLLNFIKVISIRSEKIAKYPGLTCFIITLLIFILSIPLLGNIGARYTNAIRKYLNVTTIFLAMLESIVFIMWYGLNRISEDVHFMLGVPPKGHMKVSWLLSTFILGYSFITHIYKIFSRNTEYLSENIALVVFACYLALIFILMGVKLTIAAIKNEFHKVYQIDSTWGPNSDLLIRSRTMFSAQAMTKEYMYRQYHLQAGIYERQIRSNIRRATIQP